VTGVRHFDALPPEQARAELLGCCGARRWVVAMLKRRPYGNEDEMLRHCEGSWALLGEEDLLEAIEAHPRLGDEVTVASWSAAEQATVRRAGPAILWALAEANRRYERRFGFRFVLVAERKDAELVLGLLRGRLQNDRATEFRIAAAQAARITRGRLRRLAAA
jgi:OHCU decarboxylase